MSDLEDYDCPLCMEELDISERNFKPCPCGYQICRFCWHHIKEELNGKCPACRRAYSDDNVQFTPITPAELTRIKTERKFKEREKKEIESMSRKHLANVRVVQKNLIYVIGLTARVTEEVLRSSDYFGQYGKITKVVINRRHAQNSTSTHPGQSPTVGVYITFARREDAARAIAAVDGSMSDGRILRATYGTTKYCTYYLRNMPCQNPNCMYLHEPGEEADTFTREDLASGWVHLYIERIESGLKLNRSCCHTYLYLNLTFYIGNTTSKIIMHNWSTRHQSHKFWEPRVHLCHRQMNQRSHPLKHLRLR
ncbi:hypothetical protein K493DRAFT_203009 [Basidiobolus meristosporus CBS 931.73]|uniref:Uncharacterized protein n=1 Tax=Basidiobolus meristosporus CBS 931.73 TaxID=1314790 RepID=A0A1Y1Z979_9FUNG|nr:hypothetical protein K493DRAFT_203009 [Basidiobolus meristosporus CBS 931.73]|eukprot:ORY06736.1 hypothetical protein K493DRAFT_203009 [Basidiobolus meristosporus CBS 931.73]